MNRIFFYLLLLNKSYSQSNQLLNPPNSPPENHGFLGVSILLLLFLLSLIGGYKLIRLRTGNHDIDYFTKLLGWALTVFGIYGVFECYKSFIN